MSTAAGPALINPLFGSEGWARAWAETLGSAAELVELSAGGETALLAGRSREGFRVLRLSGGEHADYEELAAAGADVEGLTAALEQALAGGGWDALVLGHVPERSATHSWALSLRDRGARVAAFGVSVGVPLAPSWEEQERSLQRKLVTDTDRRRRKLCEEIGELRFERLRETAEMLETVEFIAACHRARFRTIGRPSMFDDPATLAFYRRVVERCGADQRLHVSRLLAGDRPAAAHLGFAMPDRWEYYLQAFDEEFSRYAPSRLLLFWLMREAIDAGAGFFDLGRGEVPYKSRLDPVTTALDSVVVPAPGARGRLASAWFGAVRPRLRRRFNRLSPMLRRIGVLREYA